MTIASAHHQPAPDLQNQDVITVSALNLQNEKKDKSATFTCKAKIIGFTIRDGWYYLACPTCSKSLKFNSGKLCCGQHGEQIGHPMLICSERIGGGSVKNTGTWSGYSANL